MTGAARGRRRLALAVALVALAALAAGALHPASAARLPLTGARLTTAAAAPCATGTLAAAAPGTARTATQVVLSDVPAACRGRAATVRLYAADGTPLAAADTTVTLAAAASSTVTVPAYAPARVAGVAVTVGTWALPARWAAAAGGTGPVTPGPGTTLGELTWSQLASSGTQACVTVPVTAAAGAVWRVDLHLDQRPYAGLTSGAGFVVMDPWWARVLDDRPVDGVVSVGPRPGDEALATGRRATVTICHYDLPAPAPDPALTYTQTVGVPAGSRAYACLPVTVGVSGTPELYAGWRTDVDVAPLVAFLTARGAVPDLRTLAVGGNYAVEAVGGTVYRVTPTGWDTWAVRDDTARTFQVCLRP